MRHVEDRLRRSLITRAVDVRPDPATWARLEARLHRRARVAWSAAGITVAAALVLAALVVPGLLGETRVELSPADPPAPPPTEPEPTPEPVDFPFVSTDGEVLAVHGRAGPFALAEAQGQEILDFAIHPSSTTDDLTVVWREGRGCAATLHHLRAVGGAGGPQMDTRVAESLPATCPGRAAFAPEGAHLAWMSQPDPGPEEPVGDAFALETLAWDGGPADGPVTFAVQAEQPETFAFDLTDWIWTEGPGTATAGLLHLVGYDSHGTPAAHTLPIERQGDGALALPNGATAQEQSTILQVDSHSSDPASGVVGPTYALEAVPGEEPNGLRVVRHAGEGPTELLLPEGLLTVYGGAAETDNVWMAARGDDVLLGDGMGQAWRLPWTDDGWGDLAELDGEIRYAAPLQPAAVEEPPEGDPRDSAWRLSVTGD